MAESGRPKDSKDLNRQINDRIKNVKHLISLLPDSPLADDVATHFFELECLLDLANIELKPQS